MTPEQHKVASLSAMYGAEHFVVKLSNGRGYIVAVLETEIPGVFKTKREAIAAASRLCMAYIERSTP